MPLSSRNHWRIPKRILKTAKPTRRPMTFEDFHRRLFPPHWRANKRQQTTPIRKAAPTKSMFIIFVLKGGDLDFVSALLILRVASKVKKTRAPTGKFKASQIMYIQKHHLQLISVVKAPPIIGPKHVAIPNALTIIPRYRGLLLKGATNPIITRAPWKIPAEPTPATARPRMNVGEFGAAAQSTDPTTLH